MNENSIALLENEIERIENSELKYIESLVVSNFRGFGVKKTKNTFSVPKNNYSGLNIIVGENCSGKSTILEIINLLLNSSINENGLHTSKSMYNNFNKPFNVIGKFDNGTIKLISNNRNNIIKRSGDFKFTYENPHILHIPSRKSVNSNVLHNDPGDILNFLNQGMHNRNSVNRRNFNLNNEFLSILMMIDKNEEERQKFDEIFHKFLPNTAWSVSRSDENESGFIVRFRDEIGESMFEGVGDGLITIIYISIGIYALEKNKSLKILTIDEPEVSLHPQLIRKISEIIEEYAKKYQIFISTHSPYLINWNAIKDGAKLIRIVKENNRLKANCLDNSIFQGDNTCISSTHPHTFGLNANEVFFLRDKVILVEGQEDVICFKEIIKRIDKNINDFYFYGWGSNGANNMETIAKILSSLGYKKVVMILDGDEIGIKRAETYLQQFEKYLIKNISVEDIRDKEMIKDTKIIKKIGICNDNYKVKKDFNVTYKTEMTNMFNDIKDYFDN